MIPKDRKIHINGNGHTIIGNAFNVTGELKLTNIVLDGMWTEYGGSKYEWNNEQKLLYGFSSDYTGAFLSVGNVTTSGIVKNGVLTLGKGTVVKNARGYYGPILVKGTMNMKDGAVISGLKGRFGIIRVYHSEKAQFNMEGGEIYQNVGDATMGEGEKEGVVFYIAGNEGSLKGANVKVTGGRIYSNVSVTKSPGVVFINGKYDGKFTMTGGEIIGNTAEFGGGIYCGSSKGIIKIGKNAKIYKNDGTNEQVNGVSNIYLREGQKIEICEELKDANVGVYSEEAVSRVGDKIGINKDLDDDEYDEAVKMPDIKIATGGQQSDVEFIKSDNPTIVGVLYCGGEGEHYYWGRLEGTTKYAVIKFSTEEFENATEVKIEAKINPLGHSYLNGDAPGNVQTEVQFSNVEGKVEHHVFTNGTTVGKEEVENFGELDKNTDIVTEISYSPTKADHVAFELQVKSVQDHAVEPKEAEDIKILAAEKKVSFFDMSIFRYINNNLLDRVVEINDTVLRIQMPIDIRRYSNVEVYRHHGNVPEKLKKVESESEDIADGSFLIKDGSLYIYTSKFSTYAVGYDSANNNLPGGIIGGGGDSSKDEVDSDNDNKEDEDDKNQDGDKEEDGDIDDSSKDENGGTQQKPATPSKKEPVKTTYGVLRAKYVKTKKHQTTVKWTKVPNADGYYIYGARCNTAKRQYQLKKIKRVSKIRDFYTVHGLKKNTFYKYRVVAYKVVKGRKQIIARSPIIHTITNGGKYGVAKEVKIKSIGKKAYNTTKTISLSLHKNQKVKVNAKEVKGSKPIWNHRGICFESSNRKIARISKNGVLKAVGKGCCTIYAYAQNGVSVKIKLEVK